MFHHFTVLHHGGEFDVGRGERLAVMPGDAFAQFERHGLAIGRSFPAFGKHADRLAIGVEIDEVLLDLAADNVDAGGSLDARIELALLGGVMDVEHAALARRFLRKRPHRIDHVGRGRQQRGAAIDLKARQIHAKSPDTLLMADRSDVRLETDVTLERQRESFSNLAAIRKILSENNVLSA